MTNIKEAYRHAKQRVNPVGLAAATTLASASPFFITPLQAGLTFLIHETGKEIPGDDTIKLAAIGMLGLVGIGISILIEAKALARKKYCTSTVASALNVVTGKPLLSAATGHIFNTLQSFGINPMHIISAEAMLSGDNGKFLLENAAAVSYAITTWNLITNLLILNGRIDPVTKTINQIWIRIKPSGRKKTT